MREDLLPSTYLGLPLFATQLKHSHCHPLIDKVKKKLSGWKRTCLSFAGRRELINSTIVPIISYWLQIFLLPKQTIYDLERCIRNFLWGDQENQRKVHTLSWEEVTKPVSMGGAGVLNIHHLSTAFLMHRLWDFITMQKSLWANWISAKYLSRKTIWKIKRKPGPSWAWRSILHTRELCQPLIIHLIGNGLQTNFTADRWCGSSPLENHACAHLFGMMGINKKTMVADLICNRNWSLPWAVDSDVSNLWSQISSINIFPDLQDQIVWMQTTNGYFSLSSAYQSQFPDNETSWWKLIWNPWCIPKHSCIAWMATKGRLKSKAFLKKIGVNSAEGNCVFCSNEETTAHIILNCNHSQPFWKNIMGDLLDHNLLMGSVEVMAERFCQDHSDDNLIKFMGIAFTTIIYHIWKQRNEYIFHARHSTDEQILARCRDSIRARLIYNNVHLTPQFAAKWNLPEPPPCVCLPPLLSFSFPPDCLVLKTHNDHLHWSVAVFNYRAGTGHWGGAVKHACLFAASNICITECPLPHSRVVITDSTSADLLDKKTTKIHWSDRMHALQWENTQGKKELIIQKVQSPHLCRFIMPQDLSLQLTMLDTRIFPQI